MTEASLMHCQTRTIDPRPCEYCGTVFTPERSWGRFHTDDCRNRWHQENPKIPNPLESDDEFSMTLMNPNPSFRTRKDGDHYFIDFEISKEEWEWFTDPNIDRTGMVLELTGMVTHRAQKPPVIHDYGQPPNTVQETKPKGGQLAQEAGKMCSNPVFWEFLHDRFPGLWAGSVGDATTNTQHAAHCVREICGVHSRSEIDSLPKAKKGFMALMHEFSVWCLERA